MTSAGTAMQNAQIAGEDLNDTIALNEVTATANQASADADAAEAAFQEAAQQIASVAQAVNVTAVARSTRSPLPRPDGRRSQAG